jgi:hypothetical protein
MNESLLFYLHIYVFIIISFESKIKFLNRNVTYILRLLNVDAVAHVLLLILPRHLSRCDAAHLPSTPH